MSTHFVVIGNGAAGYRAAKTLRRADRDAQVSVFTEERYPFYLRRQLGDFLASDLSLPEVIFQSRNAYRRERIDLFLMTRIRHIDPNAHEVTFASGQRARYDRLLIATGTRAEMPDIPGTDLDGVATFDTLTPVQEIRATLRHVRRVAILSEGLIGLTITQSLVRRGVPVTQLVAGDRFWPEMLDEYTSSLVETLLEDSGVTLLRNARPRAIIGAGGRAIGVELENGETFAAELVACGCRRRPAIGLVEGSGIEVGRGIRVAAGLQTSQPDVFAAGDVAEPAGGREADDLETAFCWQRAWTQGGTAAAGMLGRGAEPSAEAVRIRTALFGNDLAVLGRGHLPEGGDVRTLELRGEPGIFRRLVFDEDLLVGAVVFGTGESVHELNRLVAERTPRDLVETTLGLASPEPAPRVVPTTFASHCPICAAELVVHQGTRADSGLRCHACNTGLLIRWDGERGWLDVSPA